MTSELKMLYLEGQIPGQIDVVFVLIHPNLCYPQCIPFHCDAEVWQVWLMVPLNVRNPGAWHNLNTSPTCPNLPRMNGHCFNSAIPNNIHQLKEL